MLAYKNYCYHQRKVLPLKAHMFPHQKACLKFKLIMHRLLFKTVYN